MKHGLLFSFFLVFHISISFAQGPEWIWGKSAGGLYEDYGYTISSDLAGNTYVTGSYRSSAITFGNTTLPNSGNKDIFIVKYNSEGTAIWAKKAGGAEDDEGMGIHVDEYGFVYMTGYFESSSIAFETTTLNNTNYGVNDYANIFVVKYDTSGQVLWAKSAGGYTDDWGYSVTSDVDSNVILTGYFSSDSLTFDTTTIVSDVQKDIFVAKFDPTGNVIWLKGFGGNKSESGYDVICNPEGEIFLTGYFYSQALDFGGTVLNNSIYSFPDFFIAKLDSSGNVLWARDAGSSHYDYGNRLALDNNGNILVTGYFNGPTIEFETTTLTNMDDDNQGDIFVAKYDSFGNLVWVKSAGGIDSDGAFGIVVDANGSSYIVGNYMSNNFNFGNSHIQNTSAPLWDIYVLKFNSIGEPVWGIGIEESDSDDYAKDIAIDSNGFLYITGYYRSDPITLGTINLDLDPYNDPQDFFIAKLDSTSSVITNYKLNEALNDKGYRIYPNPSSNKITITSEFQSSTYELRDLTGKLILTGRCNTEKYDLDLSILNNGVYIIMLFSGENVFYKKIVKN